MPVDDLVSVIMPVLNGMPWITEAIESVLKQTYSRVELVVADDGSTDETITTVLAWQTQFTARPGYSLLLVPAKSDVNYADDERAGTGAGCCRNRAIRHASARYLCIFDCDDIMHPTRIARQMHVLHEFPNAIIGSRFHRNDNSTPRYTNWLNTLTEAQLVTHRFRDCTIIQPTWMMSREVFERIRYKPGPAEDLKFLLQHIGEGGLVKRVDEDLLFYRYRPSKTSASFLVDRKDLLAIRVAAFEQQILSRPEWLHFYIWGAGRDGKAVFKQLSAACQNRVVAFCDVDVKKIGRKYKDTENGKKTDRAVPIIDWQTLPADARVVLCVANDRTDGKYESNVEKAGLVDGVDCFQF